MKRLTMLLLAAILTTATLTTTAALADPLGHKVDGQQTATAETGDHGNLGGDSFHDLSWER